MKGRSGDIITMPMIKLMEAIAERADASGWTPISRLLDQDYKILSNKFIEVQRASVRLTADAQTIFKFSKSLEP